MNRTRQADYATPCPANGKTVNVVTTEYRDWATNCPGYKVTAVQIAPASHRSKWQHGFEARAKRQGHIVEAP